MLLRQINGELVKNVSGVTLQCTEQRSITVHYDEAEFVVVGQQCGQCFGVELVITKVQGGVDRFERFEIDVYFLLFALLGHDRTTVDDQSGRVRLFGVRERVSLSSNW